MPKKILEFIEKETKGKSYKAIKYCLDDREQSTFDSDGKNPDNMIYGETEQLRNYVDLKGKSQELINQQQIYSYFLDGSRRVFKVDDMSFTRDGGKSFKVFPIVAGQIGVGCCRRYEKRMSKEKFFREIVIAVPDIVKIDNGGGEGYFENLTNKALNNVDILKTKDLQINAILPYSTKEDKTKQDEKKIEDRGTAKIQERMIECEKKMVDQLVKEKKLNQDNYLIKDGSLEYNPDKSLKQDKYKYQVFKNNYQYVIGVSKSFSTELCKDTKGKNNPGFIADLRLYQRTPVIKYVWSKDSRLGDIQFAIWYIRIREHERTRSPFDGILKIEKILVREDELRNGIDTELVDFLSAHIINERKPTCYGSDTRWANHLYPIFLTETYVKSQYISEQSFLNLF